MAVVTLPYTTSSVPETIVSEGECGLAPYTGLGQGLRCTAMQVPAGQPCKTCPPCKGGNSQTDVFNLTREIPGPGDLPAIYSPSDPSLLSPVLVRPTVVTKGPKMPVPSQLSSGVGECTDGQQNINPSDFNPTSGSWFMT